ncbi:19951_t:CDS:2 [Gigaspora margarita]|uniref:Transcription initiation factor IIF subunit alpha n=1 Tax=Gigaspora margarita TaxID=4874 RepID=A0ABN7W962_GIGMA|nr:19951_t:CDS:2 [Gigaspora margarita]
MAEQKQLNKLKPAPPPPVKKPVPAHLIGNLPKHMRAKALAALPPSLPKGNLILKKEYTITSSTLNKSKKLNIMRFHSSQKVDITKFTVPVKLQRRDPDAPQQQTLLLNRQTQIIPSPSPSPSTSKAAQQNSAPAPTSGADASLIAPYAGARHNKKNLFKKKTTQIFLADDNQRRLKAEEKLPWVLEDYEGITWIGEYEGGDSAKYGVFLGDKLEFVPIHRFYTFNRKLNYKTLTIEEAEEQMAKAKKRDNDRWMMRSWGKNKNGDDLAVVEGGIFDPKSTMKVVEGEEELIGSDEEARIPSREEYDVEEVDFEEVFETDEEPDDANPLIDDETKEVSKMKKKATSKHSYEFYESDDDDKLTSEGKQLKKLLRTAENNDVYDSDREDNPYFSESDDSDQEEPSSPQTKPPATPTTKLDKASDKIKASDKTKTPSKAKVTKPKTTSPKPKTVAKGKATVALKQNITATGDKVPSASNSILSNNVPIPSKIKMERPSSPIIEASNTQKTQPSVPTKNSVQKPKMVKTVVPVSDSKQVANKVTVKKVVGSNQVTSINRTRPAEPDSKSAISVKRPRTLDSAEPSINAAAIKRVKIGDSKISKPRDIESSNITKRPRHDEPMTSNSANNASGIQNIKRIRPSDSKTSGVSADAVKKPKTAQSTSTSGAPSRSTVPSPSTNVGNDSRLISEGEIKKLIESKQVNVTEVIKAFKKKINADSRNRDILLNITKKIATYKDGYLVLKPQ